MFYVQFLFCLQEAIHVILCTFELEKGVLKDSMICLIFMLVQLLWIMTSQFENQTALFYFQKQCNKHGYGD